MKVSVCLATYNGGKYIVEQLNSILSQLSQDDEVIISDDSSTDDTIDKVNSIQDDRIKIYYNKEQKGYTRNFENALKKASGDIIFLCDQDDIWKKNKVEVMLQKLESTFMVVSDAEIVDESLNTIHPSHFKLHGTKSGFLQNFLKTRYIGACMAFKKEILKKALPFPENQYLCAHDYWLANVAEYFFEVELVHEPLLMYRRHGENASAGGNRTTNSLYKKISTRIYTFKALLGRTNK